MVVVMRNADYRLTLFFEFEKPGCPVAHIGACSLFE